MTEEEEMDQLRKDRQYKLDALNKLRNGFWKIKKENSR
jgi:hypothetical protein